MIRNTALFVVLGAACACGSHAQAWPNKPIRLIVPFSVGGPTDQVARKAGEGLARVLAQPVVVENVVGAGGTIAMNRVIKSPADGYTLIMGAKAMMVIAPQMMPVRYNTLADLQPVSGRINYAYTLLVNNSEPSTSAAELVAKSRKIPGGISYGSPGSGSGAHLAAEHLRAEAKADFRHVPYGGTAQAVNDLMGGHIGLVLDTGANPSVLVKAGKLKAVGVTGKSRSKLLPDVPAVAESVPGFENLGWYAFFAPKGLPSEVSQRLEAEFTAIFRSREFVEFLERSDLEAVIETAQTVNKGVAADTADVQRLIKAAGIKTP